MCKVVCEDEGVHEGNWVYYRQNVYYLHFVTLHCISESVAKTHTPSICRLGLLVASTTNHLKVTYFLYIQHTATTMLVSYVCSFSLNTNFTSFIHLIKAFDVLTQRIMVNL